MLATSIAALTGNLELGEGFTWLGEWPALIAFSVAAVTETILYYLPVPALGSLVDIVEGPLVFVRGNGSFRAQCFTDMGPVSCNGAWAAIAGGGSAEMLHVGDAGLRATTAGYNPLLSVSEDAGAVITPIVAIFLPVLIVFLFLVLLVGAAFAIKFAINRLSAIREWIFRRRQIPA